MRYGIAAALAGLLALVASQRGPQNAVFAGSSPLTFGKQAPQRTPAPDSKLGKPAARGEQAAPRLEDVVAEMEALRNEVETLRHMVDMRLGGLVSDLQAENNRLREELRRVYWVHSRRGSPLDPGFPVPYPALTGEGLNGAAGIASEEPEAIAPPLDADAAARHDILQEGDAIAMTYTAISEWGRTPDEAAELGQDTPSLKGMVCVVPEGYPENGLVALGRKIRGDFDAYDNINIEVFDDKEAARLFVAENADPSGHRVMSISKYRRSGRDAIVLFRGQETVEISGTPEVVDAPVFDASQER